MTYAEIKASDKDFLTPNDVAGVLRCNPHEIRLKARDEKWRPLLGFPVVCIGNRVKIPRIGFINFWEGKVDGI